MIPAQQDMWKRFGLVVTVSCALCALDSRAMAATLHAQLFPHTGEVRLRNKGTAAVPIVFYTVRSASNALNGSPSVWRSVETNYDASGNGFIDPNGEWVIIRAVSNQLTEGALDLDGGSLAAQQSVSLGRIWNPIAVPVPDLVFEARELNEQPISIVTELTVSGDYFVDGVVNQTDYAVWRQNFGSTTMLGADGNLNGTVDTADYLIWRKNLGLSATVIAPGASLTSLSAAAVPEPSAFALFIVGCGIYCGTHARRRRH
jgi:hypothetical protein